MNNRLKTMKRHSNNKLTIRSHTWVKRFSKLGFDMTSSKLRLKTLSENIEAQLGNITFDSFMTCYIPKRHKTSRDDFQAGDFQASYRPTARAYLSGLRYVTA